MLSVTGASVGAYGEGEWADAPPKGDDNGMMLALLRSPAAADMDFVNVMAYDAGKSLQPAQAFQAYRQAYKGPVVMGVEVPKEDWGDHAYTLQEVETLAEVVHKDQGGGMMLWSLQKQPEKAISGAYPNASRMAQAICKKLELSGCEEPLPFH
jgi:chitinase